MYSIGIDAEKISRLKKSAQSQSFMKRVFSPKELALFEKRSNPYPTMAGNWAAKEAFSKALGTGVRGFSLCEVSILRNEPGAPYIELSGRALAIAKNKRLEFSVSITHTNELAQAAVIAFRKGD